MSSIGLAAAREAAAAASIVVSLSGCPTSAAAASATSSGVGATAPIATRAHATEPFSIRSCVAALVTAMSISLRGMKRRKRAPLPAAGGGKRSETTNSPASSTLRPGAVQKSSTATLRRPFGPAISTVASSTISVGMPSAAGEELHRFPPRLARP